MDNSKEKKLEDNRRSIRLNGYDYSLTGAYFVTICVRNRRSLLGHVEENCVTLSQIGEYASRYLNQISDRYDSAEMDEYVIMPNHIHAVILINKDINNDNDNVNTMDTATVPARFIVPKTVGAIHELPPKKQRRKMLVPQIIGWFKMNSAKRANEILQKSGQRFWQRNYYDHIVRNENELNRIREYIICNPMRWQFDRENPNHIPCNNDEDLNQIEEIIYGKKP